MFFCYNGGKGNKKSKRMVLLGKKAFSFLSYNADFCSNSLSCQDFFFIIQGRRIVERFCGKCLSC